MKKRFYLIPRKLYIIPLVIICISHNISCAQNNRFQYKALPAKYAIRQSKLSTFDSKAANAREGAYDLTGSLPQNYVTDGSVDYTSYLQQGITSHLKVIFPGFPILINSQGLSLMSNSSVVFQPKSKLIMAANDRPNYQMLKLLGLQNVNVFFPVLQGDRNNHTGTKGEWGMGLRIAGCTNINVYAPKISDCWGDGIYIGKDKSPSENINIYYPQLDNNRRNGMSIVSVRRLLVESPVISNTNGTMPMSGIDIEPNNNSDDVDNIDIENPITFNNVRHGIFICLDKAEGDEAKNLNIKINNHIDDGSTYGIGFHNLAQPNPGMPKFSGKIEVTNPTWKNNKNGFAHNNSYKNGLQLMINNPTVTNDKNGKSVATKLDLDDIQRSLK